MPGPCNKLVRKTAVDLAKGKTNRWLQNQAARAANNHKRASEGHMHKEVPAATRGTQNFKKVGKR